MKKNRRGSVSKKTKKKTGPKIPKSGPVVTKIYLDEIDEYVSVRRGDIGDLEKIKDVFEREMGHRPTNKLLIKILYQNLMDRYKNDPDNFSAITYFFTEGRR